MTSKINPSHTLANRAVMKRLAAGALGGMTNVSACTVTDSRFASTTAGTQAFAKEALPAVPTSFRITATIKADKTAGRYSYVGIATPVVGSTSATSQSAEVGHAAGSGILIRSQAVGFINLPLLSESQVVDGAEYRVTLVYDNAISPTTATRGRWYGSVELADGSTPPFTLTDTGINDRRWDPSANQPKTLIARTNSALGTIRDLTYVDHMFGASDDEGLFRAFPYMGDGSVGSDRCAIYSKGFAAPLRFVVWAGGSSFYGGAQDSAGGRSGAPYEQYRAMFTGLADAGYTVLLPQALHEGWGADDHLAKQLEAIDRIASTTGATDHRIYYLGYSLGGVSAWRALRGRGGYPKVNAAYIISGIASIDAYWGNASYPQLDDRWPVRAEIDDPINFSGADLIATGTRVRSTTSTADVNVTKADNHDVMKAKYAGNPLFEERLVGGTGHFDPIYWDPADAVAFFDDADAAADNPSKLHRASGGLWLPTPRKRASGASWLPIPN